MGQLTPDEAETRVFWLVILACCIMIIALAVSLQRMFWPGLAGAFAWMAVTALWARHYDRHRPTKGR